MNKSKDRYSFSRKKHFLVTCFGELLGADPVEVDHVLVVLAEERVRLPPRGAPPGRRREGVLRLRVLGHRRAPPLHRALGRRLARQRRRAEPAAVPVPVLVVLQLRSPSSSFAAGHHALQQELPGVGQRAAVHEQLDVVLASRNALRRMVLLARTAVVAGVAASVFFSAAAFLLPCNQLIS
jgi:hypothetical protein